MILAFPSGRHRDLFWGWMLGLVLTGFLGQAHGQDTAKKDQSTPPKTGEPAKAKSDAPKAKAKTKDAPAPGDPKAKAKAKGEPAKADDAPAEAEAVEEAPLSTTSVEVFKDPRAEEALTKLRQDPKLRPSRPNDLTLVKSMATGAANLDPEVLQRFVEGAAYQLLDASSIKNLLNPPPGPITKTSLNIQIAVDGLIDVLNIAKAGNNTTFLKAYDTLLIDTLSKLLDNHLVSRIEAMIVLGQVPSADVLPVLLNQLKDPKQTLWVKLWALKGLSNLAQDGIAVNSVYGVDRAFNSAKAVVEFLDKEKEAPWPALMRAAEALGSLRVSAGPTARDAAEISTGAMNLLADPSMKPEVRASAAWALGMIQVNAAIAKYNYPLIGYWVGHVSADIGESIVKVAKQNKTESEYLAGLLVGPVTQAFNGVEGARDSGLLNIPSAHPNAVTSLTYLRQIMELHTAVARAAVEVARSTKSQLPEATKTLTAKVAALKAFLEKTPPKDFHLVPPGGLEYQVKAKEPEPAGDADKEAKDESETADTKKAAAPAPKAK